MKMSLQLIQRSIVKACFCKSLKPWSFRSSALISNIHTDRNLFKTFEPNYLDVSITLNGRKNFLSTSSLISPSFQGDPIIYCHPSLHSCWQAVIKFKQAKREREGKWEPQFSTISYQVCSYFTFSIRIY